MATSALPVSADQKDEPGVQAVKVNVPGVGEIDTYIKVVTTDDVDGKTTDEVETYSFSLPVEDEEEVEVLDAEGDPVKNEDGSTKLKTEKFWKTVHYDVDMSPASRDKLIKALAPFTKNAREKKAPVITATATASKSSHDLNAIRAWAKENGHEVADKGRIAGKVMDAYYKATGKPNPDAA